MDDRWRYINILKCLRMLKLKLLGCAFPTLVRVYLISNMSLVIPSEKLRRIYFPVNVREIELILLFWLFAYAILSLYNLVLLAANRGLLLE